ncbi:564_t:CDS:2, partial [Entrophospora sp. SA101]
SSFTLPLAIYQQKNVVKSISLQPLLKGWNESIKNRLISKFKVERKSFSEFQKEFKRQFNLKKKQIYKDNNYRPLKIFILPFIQLPLFIVINVIDSNTKSGGSSSYYLYKNDPTLIFPFAIGFVNLLNIEINSWFTNKKISNPQKLLKYISRGISIIMIPIASQVPMAVCIYWLTSSTFGLFQNLLFRTKFFRGFFGYPLY